MRSQEVLVRHGVGTGGVSLKGKQTIRVFAQESEPLNPQIGDVWIPENLTINKFRLRASLDFEPAEGDVWIAVGSPELEFNVFEGLDYIGITANTLFVSYPFATILEYPSVYHVKIYESAYMSIFATLGNLRIFKNDEWLFSLGFYWNGLEWIQFSTSDHYILTKTKKTSYFPNKFTLDVISSNGEYLMTENSIDGTSYRAWLQFYKGYLYIVIKPSNTNRIRFYKFSWIKEYDFNTLKTSIICELVPGQTRTVDAMPDEGGYTTSWNDLSGFFIYENYINVYGSREIKYDSSTSSSTKMFTIPTDLSSSEPTEYLPSEMATNTNYSYATIDPITKKLWTVLSYNTHMFRSYEFIGPNHHDYGTTNLNFFYFYAYRFDKHQCLIYDDYIYITGPFTSSKDDNRKVGVTKLDGTTGETIWTTTSPYLNINTYGAPDLKFDYNYNIVCAYQGYYNSTTYRPYILIIDKDTGDILEDVRFSSAVNKEVRPYGFTVDMDNSIYLFASRKLYKYDKYLNLIWEFWRSQWASYNEYSYTIIDELISDHEPAQYMEELL